jgi:hypothetical protein
MTPAATVTAGASRASALSAISIPEMTRTRDHTRTVSAIFRSLRSHHSPFSCEPRSASSVMGDPTTSFIAWSPRLSVRPVRAPDRPPRQRQRRRWDCASDGASVGVVARVEVQFRQSLHPRPAGDACTAPCTAAWASTSRRGSGRRRRTAPVARSADGTSRRRSKNRALSTFEK